MKNMLETRWFWLYIACSLTNFLVHGTFTRVGNTYMKTPDSCCSMEFDKPVKGCGMTSLHATGREQLAYSPGFPNRFPIGRICSWSIQAPVGFQVRLEFRDFYLIGPGQDGQCSDQYVMVESPVTGHTMGRFCGNSGIPTIVSAGNLLVVRLYSEIPQSSENFRGFVFVFREATETPNPELRPGDWSDHGQYSLSPREIARELLKIKPTNAPDPNAKTTTVRNRITAGQARPPSSPEEDSDADDSKSTTTGKKKPKQNNPPKFARPKPGLNNQNIYGQNQNRDIVIRNDIDKNSNLPLRLEVLVAIGAGGLCATALIILLVCKVSQVCKKNGRRTQAPAPSPSTANEENKAEQTEERIEMSPPEYSPNKDVQLPTASPAQETNFSIPNPAPYPPEYYSSSGYPYYCASAATMPNAIRSAGMPAFVSNTLPPGYSTNQMLPTTPLPTHANPQMGNQLLLFDPTTGMLYNQDPFQTALPQIFPTNKTQVQFKSPSKPSESDSSSDTSSESSWSSYSSNEHRRSKHKSQKRKSKRSSKRKKQNGRRKKRRR